MNRKAKITKTGMITIKTGTGSTIGDQTKTNTIEVNLKHKSSSSTKLKHARNVTNSKQIH